MILKPVSNERKLFFLLVGIFIITELIDDFLDSILGISVLHSVLQLFLFLVLFFVVTKLYLDYYKKKINKLIPKELRFILEIIKESEVKGVFINLNGIRKNLGITKPTLKKRVDNLIDLKYVSFEIKGNNKYIKLTRLGSSILR